MVGLYGETRLTGYNSFQKSKTIEARGMVALSPYIKELADGRFVVFDKGPLAKHLQQVVGDVIYQDKGGVVGVEIKCEGSNSHGNFFLESWSNRNMGDGHSGRGSNPGWMMKIGADVLFYYFLEQDELYIIDVLKLKKWAFGPKWPICQYPERMQKKQEQLNDTWGWCVPIADIGRAVGYGVVCLKRDILLIAAEDRLDAHADDASSQEA